MSALNKVKRLPSRGHYDQKTIYDVLDNSIVCHVGINEKEQPVVIPTGFIRINNSLVIHGSSKSRLLLYLAASLPCCITVTELNGLVLARSAFHHSMNYRSVVVFGKAELVESKDEKLRVMKAFTDKVIPGRWDTLRPITDKELKATKVVQVEINRASAKIRTGPPVDDKEDYDLPIWAGVAPISTVYHSPEPDPKLKSGIDVPAHIHNLGRK